MFFSIHRHLVPPSAFPSWYIWSWNLATIEEHCSSLASLLLLCALLAAWRAFIVGTWGCTGACACNAQLALRLLYNSPLHQRQQAVWPMSGFFSIGRIDPLWPCHCGLWHDGIQLLSRGLGTIETSGTPTCLVSAQTITNWTWWWHIF